MYEIFARLLAENNKKTADVCRATGINSATFSEWKKGKYTPKQDKLQKIADYFHVSVDFLMTGKEPELELYNDDITELFKKIRRDAALASMIEKYLELSDKKKKHIIELVDLLSE